MRLTMVHAAIAACSIASSVWAAPLFVTLEPRHQRVQSGGTPNLLVKVTANEQAAVAKVDARTDLRDTYAKLHVMQGGKPVVVPVTISDPGPLKSADYRALDPGDSFTFSHDGSPLQLQSLKPGKYSATLSLAVYGAERPIFSNVVTFEVVGK
jgi:hypothetical protein